MYDTRESSYYVGKCSVGFGSFSAVSLSYFATARLSLIFVCLFFNMGKTRAKVFGNVGNFPMGFGSSSAQLRYVVKAVGFALTSSIARTNRSQRSRELSGRMTGGGLISGQDSLVTSSSLGRYSSSLARWRSRKDEKHNLSFIQTVVTGIETK